MTCGTCRFYQPARNPDTGRVLPSQPGECGYEVVMPAMPFSMFVWDTARFGRKVRPSRPMKAHVRPGDGAECECWAAKAKPNAKLASAEVQTALGIE